MENKKKVDADLTGKRNLFMVIGLAVSLSMTLVAFEWKSYGEGDLMDLGTLNDDFEDLIEIPPTVIPPPPPPPIIEQPVLIEVPDEVEIDEDIIVIIDVDHKPEDIIKDMGDFEPLDDEDPGEEIFIIVEEQASFPGGRKAWGDYLNKNFKYPRKAQRMGIEGNVHLSFVVDKQGMISDIEVTRGIGGGCDEEALRVLQKSPQWNPGKQRGRAVNSRMAILISFKLK